MSNFFVLKDCNTQILHIIKIYLKPPPYFNTVQGLPATISTEGGREKKRMLDGWCEKKRGEKGSM